MDMQETRSCVPMRNLTQQNERDEVLFTELRNVFERVWNGQYFIGTYFEAFYVYFSGLKCNAAILCLTIRSVFHCPFTIYCSSYSSRYLTSLP